MSIGLIGRKVGVTQVFQGDGTMVAVSVLAIEPNTVTRLRTDDRDGYTAVQLGAEPAKRLTKPEAGQLKDLPKDAQRPGHDPRVPGRQRRRLRARPDRRRSATSSRTATSST